MNLNILEKRRFFVQQFRKEWIQKIKKRVITIAYTLTANSAAVFSTEERRVAGQIFRHNQTLRVHYAAKICPSTRR